MQLNERVVGTVQRARPNMSFELNRNFRPLQANISFLAFRSQPLRAAQLRR